MNTKFWEAAGIRALRTLCQSAIGAIGASVMISDVDWAMVASTAALAAILSLLNSVATGLPEVE